IARKEA
ncbi:hypothetical protein CFC21_022580, partial [Triticum aestivum]